jgi:hypothetical protein
MTSALVVPSVVAVLTLLVLAGLVVAVIALAGALRRTREQTDEVLARAAASAAADAEALREQLEELDMQLREQAAQMEEAALAAQLGEITVVDDREYVITELGERRPLGLLPTIPGPPVVDIVLRESLIRTASLAAGLRRALAPEVRNRVRFEMKREVKRSRKRRRLTLKQARRHWEAQQRAEIDPA